MKEKITLAEYLNNLDEAQSNLGLSKRVQSSNKDRKTSDVIDGFGEIQFKDDIARELCSKIGVETLEDAAKVTGFWRISNLFSNQEHLRFFNEFQHFVNLEIIPQYCFGGDIDLYKITLPSKGNLKRINANAFDGCICLEEIEIPEGVEFIGQECFTRCINLNTIHLPSTIKTIEHGVFDECMRLHYVYVSSKISEEGIKAIVNSLKGHLVKKRIGYNNNTYVLLKDDKNNRITKVDTKKYLNESSNLGLAKKVTDKAKDRDAVENVSVIPFKDPEAADLCHSIGVYTFQDAIELIELPSECFSENDDLMYFPELQYFTSISSIPASCFNGDRFVSDIILPSSGNLKVLGEFAFCNCFELDKIEIPEGVVEIQRFCFRGCTELKSVKLPSTIQHIAGNSFDQCKNLEEFIAPVSAKENIEDEVNFIVSFIKKYTDNKKDIKVKWISGSVTESSNLGLAKKVSDTTKQKTAEDVVKEISPIEFMDEEAKRLCNELGVVTYEDARNLSELPGNESIFDSNDDLMYFPELQYFTSITFIPEFSFANDRFVSNIILPSSGKLKLIGDCAFYNCFELTEIVIPEGVQEIRKGCFRGCRELTTIKLPSTIQYIAGNCFEGCERLQEIIIPSASSRFSEIQEIVENVIEFTCRWGRKNKNKIQIKLTDDTVTESVNLGLSKKVVDKTKNKPIDNTIAEINTVSSPEEGIKCLRKFLIKSPIVSTSTSKISTSQEGIHFDLSVLGVKGARSIHMAIVIRYWPNDNSGALTIHISGDKKMNDLYKKYMSKHGYDVKYGYNPPDSIIRKTPILHNPDNPPMLLTSLIEVVAGFANHYINNMLRRLQHPELMEGYNLGLSNKAEDDKKKFLSLGLAKKVSDRKKDLSDEEKVEGLISIEPEDIVKLYNVWGHVPIEYQQGFSPGPSVNGRRNTIRTPQTGPTGKPQKSVETLIRESYSKFITDITDGDMFFNHNLSWGQESLNVLEFFDYRVYRNRRSMRNAIYYDYRYAYQTDNENKKYVREYILLNQKNIIKDWYIPATIECLKKNPEFIHYFLAKLK